MQFLAIQTCSVRTTGRGQGLCVLNILVRFFPELLCLGLHPASSTQRVEPCLVFPLLTSGRFRRPNTSIKIVIILWPPFRKCVLGANTVLWAR